MPPLYRLIALALFIGASSLSNAQQMVQTPKDLYLVCVRDNEFVGKPLRELFKAIKPPIRMVLASPGSIEEAPRFGFFFTSMQAYEQCRRQGKYPLELVVYLRDRFQWNWEERRRNKTREHYLDWNKEDEEQYGNLIVTAIRIGGTCYESDNAAQ